MFGTLRSPAVFGRRHNDIPNLSGFGKEIHECGYTLLWRKIWANPILFEKGRQFSRLEAWLHTINVLAAGMDDEKTGLRRGEFIASIRFLAKTFNWSHAMAQCFVDLLLENSMISRAIRESIRPAIQDAGHFIVCNYETYNQTRYTDRYGKRYAERYKIKEVVKEGFKEEEKKVTHVPSGNGVRVPPKTLVEIYQQQNQSLPEVKALTSERLKKCRSRIDQAVRDGCLSPGRSFLTGWRVAETPGIVIRVCPRRVRIKVFLDAREKTVNVDPDNLIGYQEINN